MATETNDEKYLDEKKNKQGIGEQRSLRVMIDQEEKKNFWLHNRT